MNRVSVVPTLILLTGFVVGTVTTLGVLRRSPTLSTSDSVIAFAAAAVAGTFGGYLWFLANYVDQSNDTVKATYVLQAFPFLALLGAAFLRRDAEAVSRSGWTSSTGGSGKASSTPWTASSG